MCARCVQDVCKMCARCVQGVRKMCAGSSTSPSAATTFLQNGKKWPEKSAPECPVECGWVGQSLFGQCPNVGGVNAKESSLILPFYNGKNWTKIFTFAYGQPDHKKTVFFTTSLLPIRINRCIPQTFSRYFCWICPFCKKLLSGLLLAGRPINSPLLRESPSIWIVSCLTLVRNRKDLNWAHILKDHSLQNPAWEKIHSFLVGDGERDVQYS